MIENAEQLKQFFIKSDHPNCDGVYVSTAVRKQWMLNHTTVTIKGTVRTIKFINKGGGVWQANLSVA